MLEKNKFMNIVLKKKNGTIFFLYLNSVAVHFHVYHLKQSNEMTKSEIF